MVSGAADTPAGSVIGCNVVSSSPACHPYWTGSEIGGSDGAADCHTIA